MRGRDAPSLRAAALLLGPLYGPKPMPLTICEYRGHRISLLSSDAGHSALVHKSGAVLGFARSSRNEGLRGALVKALDMINKARPEDAPQDAPVGLRHQHVGRLKH